MQKEIVIDLSELDTLCTPNTLKKGQGLAKSGAVSRVTIEGDLVIADVTGTHVYKVQLNTQPQLSARCTCPAADFQSFCKHAVALALIAEELPNNVHPPSDAKNEQTIIREYLNEFNKSQLVDMLLDNLEADEVQWKRILTKLRLRDKSLSFREIKSLVTKALPRRQIWNWREVGSYFDEAHSQLEMLWEAAESLEVEQQWKLINYTVERLNAVLEQIDDSNGERFGVEGLINHKMPAIFARLEWSEEQRAEWMFERLTSHEFDFFPSIEDHFELQWRANPHFLTLCRHAIEQDKAKPSRSWNRVIWSTPLLRVSKDWREKAEIKQQIAQCCRDFLGIADLYLSHNEFFDAEHWLEKARKCANEKELRQCDKAQVRLFFRLGELNQAWHLSNRLFVDKPTFRGYKALDRFKAEHHIDDDTFIPRVEKTLVEICQSTSECYASLNHDALLEFYIDRQEWDKACAWAISHQVGVDVLIELANNIVCEKPQETLQYYFRAAQHFIEQTNNDGYHQALTHLQRLESILAVHPKILAIFYTELKILVHTYKRKRNMLALFTKHYAKYL